MQRGTYVIYNPLVSFNLMCQSGILYYIDALYGHLIVMKLLHNHSTLNALALAYTVGNAVLLHALM